MRIREIQFKDVAGEVGAQSLKLEGGLDRVQLPEALASAVPDVLLTLLFPAECEPVQVKRVSGPAARGTWGMVAEFGKRLFRISRSADPSTVTLELSDPREGSWKVARRGANDVQHQLRSVLKLPSYDIVSAVQFAITTIAEPAPDLMAGQSGGESDGGGEDDEGISTLVSSNDYFDTFAGGIGAITKRIEFTEEDRVRTVTEYRRARLFDLLQDQGHGLETQLDEAVKKLSESVDSTGELTQISQKLARLPEVTQLDPADEAALQGGDGKVVELEDRLDSLRRQLEDTEAGSGRGPRPLWQDPFFMGGVVAAVVLTVLSVTGGRGQRPLAFGNIVVLAVALLGFIQHLTRLESQGRGTHKVDAIRRRLEQVETEHDRITKTLERLRRESAIYSYEEYVEARDQRVTLAKRKDELTQRHASKMQSPEYKQLEARIEHQKRLLREHKNMLADVGASTVPTYELEGSLTQGGLDPYAIYWDRPGREDGTFATEFRELATTAKNARLLGADGMDPELAQLWQKLAARAVGDSVPTLTISMEGSLDIAGVGEPLEDLPKARVYAIVEALRLALLMVFLQRGITPVAHFVVRVAPVRVYDELVATNLAHLYESISSRIQILWVEAASE